MKRWIACVLVGFLALVATGQATETENLGIRVLPAPGKVTVDGGVEDWDLTGGVFICSDVERLKDNYSVWYHLMYDADNLYILARWRDPTPLNHPGLVNGSYGFHGDCLQARFIADQGTPDERVSHWTCWMDKDGNDVLQGAYGRKFKSGKVEDAQKEGGAQAFRKGEDGETYVQEIAIPWALLTKSGKAPAVGQALWTTVEPNYTAGVAGRISIKGIFRPGVAPDRVFTFRAYRQWGDATLEAEGNVEPRPVRLADAREFTVSMQDGRPEVDWDGLIESDLWPGFEQLTFKMPFDGLVSLNITDKDGKVVRQLLTGQFFAKGERTVEWDGLSTPYVKDPGAPVEGGTYTWRAIAHPGIGLRLRGWAHHGGTHPWSAGPGTGWGGNHGAPCAAAADGKRIYLGWSYAEGPAPLVAVDADGNVKWRLGMGGKDEATTLAVDAGTVYAGFHGNQALYRVDAESGEFSSWEGAESTERHVEKLWDAPEGMPNRFVGMDVADGKVYLSFGPPTLFLESQITDWKAFLTRLKEDPGPLDGIYDGLMNKFKRPIERFLKGQVEYKDIRVRPVLSAMNERLDAPALGAGGETPLARRMAARATILAAYGGLIRQPRGEFMAVLDGATGKLEQIIDVPLPGAVAAAGPNRVLVVSGATDVLALDPAAGKVTKVLTGVGNIRDLAVREDGGLCVLAGEPENQVKLYDAGGKLQKALGKLGGRAPTGPWNAEAMRAPSALAIDAAGRAWVAESIKTPKRFVVWDLEAGKVVDEHFGPSMYGASGGAILPQDPNIMVGQACEWKLNPETGRAQCLGVFDTRTHGFATFRTAKNGRTYLFAKHSGHLGSGHVSVFERLGDGRYAHRLELLWVGRGGEPVSSWWIDANGDGALQDNEAVQKMPRRLRIIGSNGWSLNVGPDMALYGYMEQEGVTDRRGPSGDWVRVPVTGFDESGAPLYAFDKPQILPAIPGGHYHHSHSQIVPSADGQHILTNEQFGRGIMHWVCYNADGTEELWRYPNPFFQVHGSHRAPPPTAGLFRGGFGVVGYATLPEPVGNVWVMNTNVGEWHVLNEDGFYITKLFEGDPFKRRWPDQATPGAIMDSAPPGSGGEDFGGSATQGQDGKLYVQSGKAAYWNLVTVGWDEVVEVGEGSVEISDADRKLADRMRIEAMQKARGRPLLVAKRMTPAFTGDLRKDFTGCPIAEYRKQSGADVKTVIAWDDKNLYVGWEVNDATPWINKAGEAPMMYASGDSVDLQIGTQSDADPDRAKEGAGDVRVNIGPFEETPTAAIYRTVSAQEKERVFSSGVERAYPVDYVAVLDSAKIHVDADANRKRYVVEVALPLVDLGLTPEAGLKIRGDFGAMHSDAAGENAVLRTYWSNQDTGLVDDVVFELQATPKNWGEILFRE